MNADKEPESTRDAYAERSNIFESQVSNQWLCNGFVSMEFLLNIKEQNGFVSRFYCVLRLREA